MIVRQDFLLISVVSVVYRIRSPEDLVLQLDGGTGTPEVEDVPYVDVEALGISLSGPFVGTMDWGIGRLVVGAGKGLCAYV